MDVVFLIGRVLFGALFVYSGISGHFAAGEITKAYARQAGAPAPEATVPLTGVVIIAGGLMVILGIWADLGALLIAGFLFLTSFIIHRFWRIADPQMRQMDQVHFSKDLALAGAALVMFYTWNQLQGDAGLSITDPLFSRG